MLDKHSLYKSIYNTVATKGIKLFSIVMPKTSNLSNKLLF